MRNDEAPEPIWSGGIQCCPTLLAGIPRGSVSILVSAVAAFTFGFLVPSTGAAQIVLISASSPKLFLAVFLV